MYPHPASGKCRRSSKTLLISGGGATQRVRYVSTKGSQILQLVSLSQLSAFLFLWGQLWVLTP